MNMSDQIYLDVNATTPVAKEVVDCICYSLEKAWGNPSSSHSLGATASDIIEKARDKCASMIGANKNEIIFTSGGTETNHIVIHTFNELNKSATMPLPHIVTSTIEHDSITKPLKELVRKNLAEVTFLNVNSMTYGVAVENVVGALKSNTVLVTVMLANNETGVLQPVKEIAEAVKVYASEHDQQIYVHTDAAQALGKVPVNVNDLDVDYLTVVGHKFYGPRIGALYVRGLGTRHACPLKPVFFGGGQERSYRPGTENTAMIAGLGKAAELVILNIDKYYEHMLTKRDYLESELAKAFGDQVAFNGRTSSSSRIPNTCNISILGSAYKGHSVLAHCKKLIASVGAACHSGQNGGSTILIASGVRADRAQNAIRLSVGRETSSEEIDETVSEIKEAVNILQQSQ